MSRIEYILTNFDFPKAMEAARVYPNFNDDLVTFVDRARLLMEHCEAVGGKWCQQHPWIVTREQDGGLHLYFCPADCWSPEDASGLHELSGLEEVME